MRKLLVLLVVIGAFAFTALPAVADALPPGLPCTPTANGSGAAGCTINAHPITLPFFAGPCLPAFMRGTLLTGNAVFHVTQNTATDFWITTTQEGSFVGLPVGFSGRATQWFGLENNSMNIVVHFISDGQVSGPGTSFSFHETGHFSFSASTPPNMVAFDNCTVS